MRIISKGANSFLQKQFLCELRGPTINFVSCKRCQPSAFDFICTAALPDNRGLLGSCFIILAGNDMCSHLWLDLPVNSLIFDNLLLSPF